MARKSLHALRRLYEKGDIMALEKIQALCNSNDEMVSRYAMHQINKLK